MTKLLHMLISVGLIYIFIGILNFKVEAVILTFLVYILAEVSVK
jgi:hypothetical protein